MANPPATPELDASCSSVVGPVLQAAISSTRFALRSVRVSPGASVTKPVVRTRPLGTNADESSPSGVGTVSASRPLPGPCFTLGFG